MSAPAHEGIVILGHPRSGTTLLRRLLDRHSRIACPGETHLLSAAASFIRSQPTADGVDMGVLAGLSFAGFDDEVVLARLREFTFAFSREHAARRNKPRWAEKTAFDAFAIPEIERLCGDDVYFIGLVRHALDVALSCQDFVAAAGTYPRAMHPYIQRSEMPLEAFVRSWVDVNQELLEFAERHPGNAVLCRYEDLVDEPEEALTALLDFVGEGFEPSMLVGDFRSTEQSGFGDHKSYQFEGVTKSRTGRFKKIPPWMAARLGRVANPTLERFGYERVDAGDDRAADEKDARRRYQRSLGIHAKRARD